VENAFTNCGLTRLLGFTLYSNGEIRGDVWLHAWAEGWRGAWRESEWCDLGSGNVWQGDEGNGDLVLDGYPKDGVWVSYLRKGAGNAFPIQSMPLLPQTAPTGFRLCRSCFVNSEETPLAELDKVGRE
jgi:hypothetical protein